MMNNWVAGIAVAAIATSVFLATAPQREVARRELERQDALIERERLSLEAVAQERALRANEFLEKTQVGQEG